MANLPRIGVDPFRLLAVPTTTAGHRVFVVLGSTLRDRRDALNRLLISLAIGRVARPPPWQLALNRLNSGGARPQLPRLQSLPTFRSKGRTPVAAYLL